MTTNRITCREHNVSLCSICCRRPNQCDHGTCGRKATTVAEYRNVAGEVIENRPACAKHVRYMGGTVR
jgi:hypothetical protein